jgi:hypothetical protein
MGWMFPTAVSTFRRKVLIKRKSKLTSGMMQGKEPKKPIPAVTTATKRSQWIRPGPSLLATRTGTRLRKNGEEERKAETEGDEAMNKLFKQIYGGADRGETS